MFNALEINNILKIACDAGQVILGYYRGHAELNARMKLDKSAVTAADIAANKVIINGLSKHFPHLTVVSEENSEESNKEAIKNDTYFIIDPLDGTSAFLKKSDEFTVNIALIKNKNVIFGAIYVPEKDLMYFVNENKQSIKIENYFSNPQDRVHHIIRVLNKKNKEAIVICTSREPEKSEIVADLKRRKITIKKVLSISSSYKFCIIAEGKADLYPRKANIKAWDVAAGHAIVNSAGGRMVHCESNNEIQYDLNKNFEVPHFEVF